jgi:hypothetical protein
MRIYLAGTSVCDPDENKLMQELFQQGSKLHSYFHCKDDKGFERRWFLMNALNQVDLFLDSGAFSAWTQGISINIQEYIDFIKEHQDIIEVYANLDVIAKGNTLASKEEAAKQTLRNQRIMEKAGLKPLPVFHIGEPFRYLEGYLKKYDYICLGGMVGKPKSTLVPWLNKCFGEYLCDGKGLPKVKVHGFGLTSLPLMLQFPWYSVDSTSWVTTGRMGSIYVPRYRQGKPIYDENSWKIAVSSRSPSMKDAGQHIDTLPPKQKAIILEYIHSKGYQLGKSRFERVMQVRELAENERWAERKPKNSLDTRLLEIIEEPGVSNMYQLRDEMNIIYFQDLEKSMPKWPWPFQRQGLKGFSF